MPRISDQNKYPEDVLLTGAEFLIGTDVDQSTTTFSLNSIKSFASEGKQDTLVSGQNIKTVNGETLLGSGNIIISGSGLGVSNQNIADDTNRQVVIGGGTAQLNFLIDGGIVMSVGQNGVFFDGSVHHPEINTLPTSSSDIVNKQYADQQDNLRLLSSSNLSDLNNASTSRSNLGLEIGSDVQAWSSALDSVTGVNTGDQDSIVGISGTKAQFNSAVTDGSFLFVGDAPTAHTHVEADITDLQSYLLSVDISDINTTGTPDSTTFLRGDGSWQVISGGGSGDLWSDPVDSDIIPDGNSTRVLGSLTNRFQNVYSSNVNSTNITGNNSTLSYSTLTPRSTEPPSVEGLFYYDSDDDRLKVNNGSAFESLAFQSELDGYFSKTGTTANNQVLIADGDGSAGSSSGLTYDGVDLSVTGGLVFGIGDLNGDFDGNDLRFNRTGGTSYISQTGGQQLRFQTTNASSSLTRRINITAGADITTVSLDNSNVTIPDGNLTVTGLIGATSYTGNADAMSIADSNGDFTDDTVGGALAELAAAASGGISTENQRKIDNARDFFIQYHTADQTINSVPSYITYQTANDENKKIINTVEGTNDVDYLIEDIAEIGQTIIVDNDGTGTVTITADSTETFIGSGITTENRLTLPQWSRVILTKKKANIWRADGDYTASTFSSATNLYTTSNAMGDDTNAVTGLTSFGGGGTRSVVQDASDGVNAIRFDASSANDYVSLDDTSVTLDAGTYRLTVDYKSSANLSSGAGMYNFGNGFVASGSTDFLPNQTTYTPVSIDFTVAANATNGRIRFYIGNEGAATTVAGSWLQFDNAKIEQI